MHRFDESFIVGFIHGKAKVIPKIISLPDKIRIEDERGKEVVADIW